MFINTKKRHTIISVPHMKGNRYVVSGLLLLL